MENDQHCDWFNIETQKIVYLPEKYKKMITNINFKNVITNVHTCKLKDNISICNTIDDNSNESLERTYKYNINFTKEQKIILRSYFNECTRLYNLCVDIWIDYKEVTDC